MPLSRRARAVSLLLFLVFLLAGAPVEAAIGPINPAQPAASLLGKADSDKLAALQTFIYPVPLSDISPDDRTMFVGFLRGFSEVAGIGFIDITTGAFRSIDRRAFISSATGEYRWLDSETLGYIALDRSAGPVQVTINRATGTVRRAPLSLPGFPLTLSPGGQRAVLAIPARDDQPARQSMLESPFSEVIQLTLGGPPALPEEFGRSRAFDPAEGTLRAAATRVNLVALDLASGTVTPLYELTAGTIPLAWAWSADSARFAMVRTSAVEGRAYRINDLIMQDALGNLAPEKNPFLQRNVVDTVDFAAGTVRPAMLRAAEGNGDTFFNVEWAPDGRTLLAQMAVPSRLSGRAYPVYIFAFAERLYLRFYSPDGQLLNTVDSPDIEAPYPVPIFAGPDEVIISAANGTDIGLFYYNRASGEFRRLPLPPGASPYDARVARGSRQVVFSFSSFTQVPELFRMSWEGTALAAVTYNNAALAEINAVRADQVSFTLADGQQRTGYLIQPAGAAFPPRDAPLIVWQEGGPSSEFSNSYGGVVERPLNILPNMGLPVLFVPLTGRVGFGVERYRALYNDRNFGQQDIDEMAEILRQTIERGWTSQGKIGVTGCSYGGYFAAQSITRYPDLYAAANPQCSLVDLFYEWQFGTRSIAAAYFMGATATTDGAAYAADSPLYNSGRARAATLIFHGTEDFLPIQLMATFHDQLLANGAAVNLYAFQKQGHGLRALNSQRWGAELQVQWFREYLGK